MIYSHSQLFPLWTRQLFLIITKWEKIYTRHIKLLHSSKPHCDKRHGDQENLQTGLNSPSWTVSPSSTFLYAQTGVYPSTSLRYTSPENPTLKKYSLRLFNPFCYKCLLKTQISFTIAHGQDPSPSAWPGPTWHIHHIHQNRITALLLDPKKRSVFCFARFCFVLFLWWVFFATTDARIFDNDTCIYQSHSSSWLKRLRLLIFTKATRLYF